MTRLISVSYIPLASALAIQILMGMEFEECGHGGDQTSYVDDDDQDFSISESSNSDWSTSSTAESLSVADTTKETYDAAKSARLFQEEKAVFQRFQTRPEPRVPLALQDVYIKSCMNLVVEELPPGAGVYISQRVGFLAICLVSSVSVSFSVSQQLPSLLCSHLPSSTWKTH
jgi:hypothetical protein